MTGIREHNEDSYLIAKTVSDVANLEFAHGAESERYSLDSPLPDDSIVAIVADGMGGMANGDVASYLVASTFIERFLEEYDPDDVRMTICDTLRSVSDRVGCNCPNGGSTIAGMIAIGGVTYVFNVGDSRVIARHAGGIYESPCHALSEGSSVLTSWMGREPDSMEMSVESFEGVDSIAIFSDGLNAAYDFLGNGILDSECTSEELCNLALQRGSSDNVTCIRCRL